MDKLYCIIADLNGTKIKATHLLTLDEAQQTLKELYVFWSKSGKCNWLDDKKGFTINGENLNGAKFNGEKFYIEEA